MSEVINKLETVVLNQVSPEMRESNPQIVEPIVSSIVYILTAPFDLKDAYEHATYDYTNDEFEVETVKVMNERLQQIMDTLETNPRSKLGKFIIKLYMKSLSELASLSESWKHLYNKIHKVFASLDN
ncbi:hypothetical protein [Heyndrickxia camelliae]|uniref:Uncharacterized protein n=1 Tax=Heyndrickxia camelliae TaxID=1707093 RepID=A0A2N3LFQ2_9BACI|nr:hypothetical protein [Heyndrickxia camelliae]PKR83458.1 hypothetical protein CWO92_19025 [Heyndrickxia camelliae]